MLSRTLQRSFAATTLDDTVSASLSSRRVAMIMIATFAGVTLGLASLGIHGVASYMVAERGQEIAVRVGLGAQRGDVLPLVPRQGFEVARADAAIGLVGALTATRLMAGLLYGVQPWIPGHCLPSPRPSPW